MVESKAWDWNKETDNIWLKPCEESYYILNEWKTKKFTNILDYGCGLGRHSMLFAKNGFNVNSFDLSTDGIQHLQNWAKAENVNINIKQADMKNLPYKDDMFDGIFAYNVISHTDTVGVRHIIKEIERVLKVGGEIFLTLCSKQTYSFKDANYPKVDENTVIKTEEGPEKGIPHFFVDREDIFDLFSNFEIIKIRHIDDCYTSGKKQNSKHYFVYAKLKNK